MKTTAESTAKVLEAHEPRTGVRDGRVHCLCGETFGHMGVEDGPALHRQHVADRIVATLGIETMRQHMEEQHRLLARMDDLLTRTANAVKGPPEPLEWHDWVDLPAVAAQQRGALAGTLYDGESVGVRDALRSEMIMQGIRCEELLTQVRVLAKGWQATPATHPYGTAILQITGDDPPAHAEEPGLGGFDWTGQIAHDQQVKQGDQGEQKDRETG